MHVAERLACASDDARPHVPHLDSAILHLDLAVYSLRLRTRNRPPFALIQLLVAHGDLRICREHDPAASDHPNSDSHLLPLGKPPWNWTSNAIGRRRPKHKPRHPARASILSNLKLDHYHDGLYPK
jgi:hypothetical protein